MTRRNPSELDADLGEMESEEEFTFPPAERRLVTQPVDLSVQTLIGQWDAQTLILPDIQREYVWDNGRASRLIESLILNIPIPVLYFAETREAKYEIIDGHQRVRSIVRFIHNEFALSGLAVLREYKGLRFRQLPDKEQRFLNMRTLRAIIISIESHPTMKFEIFERLNTGAITLNAQEVRNSIYHGRFNSLLHELAREGAFRGLIGTKLPRKRMVDEELILRFFAMRAGLEGYKTPLKRFLNNYMESVRQFGDAQLAQHRETFAVTVTRVGQLLGTRAFRITGPNGEPLEAIVNRALFECQMLANSWLVGEVTDAQAANGRQGLAALFGNQGFLDSIRRATGDRARTLKRLRDTVGALRGAGLGVEVPFNLEE